MKKPEDVRLYRAQERAFCPGIVKDWPKVWRMPRKVPNGRLVAVSIEEVVAELRELGYRIEAPWVRRLSTEPNGTPPLDAVPASTSHK